MNHNIKHGHTQNGKNTPTYTSWISMRNRCFNPTNNAYFKYGGRGIFVCKRWEGKHGFQNFIADLGTRPARTTLHRINNDLGYNKRNCKWSSPCEQQRHTRTNVLSLAKVQEIRKKYAASLKKYGIQTQLAKEFNVPFATLNAAIRGRTWTCQEVAA